MLVEIVLTVCLAVSGAECHKEHLVIQGDGSLYHCMAESPIHIARWTTAHPKWHVKRWKCSALGREEDNI